ncbi:MAG TPA: amylo-alpha-1,6-glucosidase [Paludibacter sp.]|nr:amylo-alpha-1,6-glucosidase [Paludibacter sp.]
MKLNKTIILPFSLIILYSTLGLANAENKQTEMLDRMKISVSAADNRPVSFTNKEAAYYYTQTHLNNHPEWAWFEGLNIAKNRVFSGYQLFVGGKKLDTQQAEASVYPYKLVRSYPAKYVEELQLVDYKNIIDVSLSGTNEQIGITLKGEKVHYLSSKDNLAFYSSNEGDYVIAVGPKIVLPIEIKDNIVYTSAKSTGFFIAVGKTDTEAATLLNETRPIIGKLEKERVLRMQNYLATNTYFVSNNDSLTLAMNWIQSTMDQLVTKQQGNGIYAGLPWFNEYWGRDEFISFPGAVLITGQFETARKILKSFAEYQNADKNSKFFGRVPNIVNPQNIDYHTTDGTPRFIIELLDYVKYSGDISLIKELYPNVQNSIEGAVRNWTDDKGYLLHADNETWMDARDANLASYTPRSSRANDIQALWYQQLCAGVYFARFMNDTANMQKWQAIADKVKSNFEKDYRDDKHDYLADFLSPENKADFTLRPNQLYALDLVSDETFRWQVTRKSWEELVYPWGVASLNRQDKLFHPFHLSSENYHKDAAYHRGTIWLWNNGMAMQRMIEAGQVETAYKLFENMSRQALTMGVVGGLSENMDAYPHEGKNWPKLTGTYLQAWSNAEHIRVWYQYFLGIRPDMIKNSLTLAPRVPAEIKNLDYNFTIGSSLIRASYVSGKTTMYRYQFGKVNPTIEIDVFPYEIKQVQIPENTTLQLEANGGELNITILDKQGKAVYQTRSPESAARLAKQKKCNLFMNNVQFAHPIGLENHPVIKTY